MRVIGCKINKRDMDKNLGLMEQSTKDSIKQGKNMGKGYLCGETIVHMKENFLKIIFMEKDDIHGKMVEFMMEIGKITKCKEKVYLHGLMVVSMKEITKTIKKKVLEFLHSEMEEFIKDNG